MLKNPIHKDWSDKNARTRRIWHDQIDKLTEIFLAKITHVLI